MSNEPTPSAYAPGSGMPASRRSPRLLWRYASTQWRRAFGLNLSRIDDLLYVGGEFRPAQWPRLHTLGVRAVLSLQAEREDEFIGEPPVTALRLEVPDFHPPSVEQLHEAVAFIRAAHADGLPVLVHCHAGVGRAPLTAAAYLISRGMNTEGALEHLRLARPIIALNLVQHARLVEWELRHRNGTTREPLDGPGEWRPGSGA